jgi:hypothetical protein
VEPARASVTYDWSSVGATATAAPATTALAWSPGVGDRAEGSAPGWVLVGDELVPEAALEPPAPTRRRRRWPAVAGVAAVVAALGIGAQLSGDPPGPYVRVLPSGEERPLAEGIARAPSERWRTEAVAGRVLTDIEQIGERLVLVAPTPRSRQGQDVVVLRTTDGAQVWNGSVSSWSAQQPPIAGTTLLANDRNGRRLRGIDLLSGAERWSQTGSSSFVLVPPGRTDVVLTGGTGGLVIRDVDTGAERWKPLTPNRGGAALGEALVLVEGTVAVAYDWVAGTPRWRAELGAAPSWMDGVGGLVLARVGTELVGIGPDGTERWRRPWSDALGTEDTVLRLGTDALVTVGDTLAVVDGGSGRTELDGITGTLEVLLTTPDRSRVFLRRPDGVVEIDLRTGEPRRTLPSVSGVLGVSDTIVYGVVDTELRGYELSSLQQLWRVRLDETSTLESAGSVLVLRTADGVLRALA